MPVRNPGRTLHQDNVYALQMQIPWASRANDVLDRVGRRLRFLAVSRSQSGFFLSTDYPEPAAVGVYMVDGQRRGSDQHHP
jgi:hypothetical protein